MRIEVRERATTSLRKLLARERPLLVLGAHNALAAKVVEAAGFSAVYMTGYGTSLALLGLPDVGLATATEMQLNARWMANAVAIPVIADSDNGYGNAINVIRTVHDYIQTGVAALHLEDQVLPKRCGHVAGRRVISIDDAVGKIRAADAVRRALDPDFVLIARTDARGAVGGSLDEAIRRAKVFLEAGADLAFVEGPTDVTEVQHIARELPGSVFYNQTGMSPRFTAEELAEMGIAVAIFPGVLSRVAMRAMYDFATELKRRGPVAEVEQAERAKGHPIGDEHEFAGFGRIRSWEERFLPVEELGKYEASLGHQPRPAPIPGPGRGGPSTKPSELPLGGSRADAL